MVLFHFAVPFSLLLSRYVKARTRVMVGVSLLLLIMRFVDLFWYVVPALGGHGAAAPAPVSVHWMDLSLAVGIGGLWLSFFAWHLKGRPLMPLHDPRMQDAFQNEEGH